MFRRQWGWRLTFFITCWNVLEEQKMGDKLSSNSSSGSGLELRKKSLAADHWMPKKVPHGSSFADMTEIERIEKTREEIARPYKSFFASFRSSAKKRIILYTLHYTSTSTVKSRFNESQFNVKSQFKVQNLVTKIEFLIKKSLFSVKSRFKVSKCADRGHSLNRDFTVLLSYLGHGPITCFWWISASRSRKRTFKSSSQTSASASFRANEVHRNWHFTWSKRITSSHERLNSF